MENHFHLPIEKSRVDHEGRTMTRTITISTSILAAAAFLGISKAAAVEETYVIREGRLIKEGLNWPDMDPVTNPFWTGWVHCGGETVDDLFVVEKRDKNHTRFYGAKSALGDCEFRVVFSCTQENSNKWNPNITIHDRGRLRFSDDGGRIWLETRKTPLPLETFSARSWPSPRRGQAATTGATSAWWCVAARTTARHGARRSIRPTGSFRTARSAAPFPS
jgi:hypothetical protein